MTSRSTPQRLAAIRKVRTPRVLWKYGSAGAVAILENLSLRVTRPNQFNDPFELSPGVVGDVSEVDIARFYADPEWVAHWDAPPIDAADPVAQKAAYRHLAAELTDTSREIMAEEIDRISAKYGIVCLTADPASLLMWSHYADNHRGLAIGIDHRKLGRMPLFPVSYGNRRVLFSAVTPLQIKPNVRSFEIFTRKSEAWAYEREYRMIWPLSETIPNRDGDRDVYAIPLSSQAIAEVRLGARASDELEQAVLAALIRHGASTRVTRAHLHPRQYRLEFRAVTPGYGTAF